MVHYGVVLYDRTLCLLCCVLCLYRYVKAPAPAFRHDLMICFRKYYNVVFELPIPRNAQRHRPIGRPHAPPHLPGASRWHVEEAKEPAPWRWRQLGLSANEQIGPGRKLDPMDHLQPPSTPPFAQGRLGGVRNFALWPPFPSQMQRPPY
jgi:hypothetical protein